MENINSAQRDPVALGSNPPPSCCEATVSTFSLFPLVNSQYAVIQISTPERETAAPQWQRRHWMRRTVAQSSRRSAPTGRCVQGPHLADLPGVVAVTAAALQLQLPVPALQTVHLAPQLLHLGAHAHLAAPAVQQLLCSRATTDDHFRVFSSFVML